ncbi:Crp/Fnr family transcriptional regulator [Rhodoferax koreense]|uniref:Crp/Fnr family transcriptional regulator n=1 Tax=Rhodoferax koreensis TaxID=1842727 RepID=A0A1P8K1Y5_9BURK|nr:cyclic nucleotide-binding domain-containing protein [Rhodoferax koreense]APW40032.1 Crp/Fnr family transcriptional regulator [Rhodoferax koreense]
MKGLLDFLRPKPAHRGGDAPTDSVLFTTAFNGQGIDPSMMVPWEARAVEVGARRMSSSAGVKLLQTLWAKDKNMELLDAGSIERMERFFYFATVPGGRDLIRQGEYGNFMIVLLKGTIAVDRLQPWGEHLRLAETKPGDILGEMSLLDSGIRFSACTTLDDCEIAALSAESMDDMMNADPRLAAALIALLARKLSLRLRAVSARFSDRPN